MDKIGKKQLWFKWTSGSAKNAYQNNYSNNELEVKTLNVTMQLLIEQCIKCRQRT